MDSTVDLASLAVRKDQLVALFNARTSRWHSVQTAALTALALAFFGLFTGAVSQRALAMVFILAATTFAVSARVLFMYEQRFEDDMEELRMEIEMLKARRVHG